MVRHQVDKLKMKQIIRLLGDLSKKSKKRIAKREVMFRAAFLEVMHGEKVLKKCFDVVVYNRTKSLARMGYSLLMFLHETNYDLNQGSFKGLKSFASIVYSSTCFKSGTFLSSGNVRQGNSNHSL